MPEKSNPEDDLFEEALLKSSDAERAAFLESACENQPALRARLEIMLEGHLNAAGFLATVPEGGPPQQTMVVAESTGSEQLGRRIGHYKLLQQLGEGGCGIVYLAEQERPVRRRVALKVIKLGMDTRSVIARFEAERQALALMDHPNIAKVFDAGTTDTGRPYFVMELVRGVKITDYCDQNHLSTGQRLTLFTQVCHAIQHAHQKGIIHRDIKPSNILVTLHDGVPVPKVIDFGIAKATCEQRLTDKTIFTAFEQFIGTPAYMSPEQAEMSGLDIDTRSDIYSLGVLLYELLTGSTPFDAQQLMASGLDAMRKTIREKEPQRPSTKLSQTLLAADVRRLQSPPSDKPTTEEEVRASSRRLLRVKETITALRGDLDWIVMKCLEKDRSRRYETANGLAADLKRHLNNEPVVARPPTAAYRFQKAFRRNKLIYSAGTAVALALVAGVGFSAWQANVAERARGLAEKNFNQATAAESRLRDALTATSTARNRAELNAETARQNLYAADMNLVHRALQEGDLGQARQLLGPRDGHDSDLCGFEYQLFREQARGDQFDSFDFGSIVTSVVFVPHKERQWVAATWDRRIAVHDLDAHGSPMYLTARSETAVLMHQVAFSPDGSILASTGKDGIELWNIVNWSRRDTSNAPALLGRGFSSICFSPEGSFLAAQRGGLVCLWNTSDWSIADQIDCGAANNGRVLIFIDNRRLAVSAQNQVQVWQIDGTRRQLSCTWKSTGFSSQPGGLLAHGGYLAAISGPVRLGNVVEFKVWNLETFELAASRDGAHQNFAFDLCISPDGTRILSAGGDQLIKVWTFPKLELVDTLLGHGNEVWALAFSPDGKALASGGKDEAVRLWQFDRLSAPPPMAQPPAGSRMSEDGTQSLVEEGAGTFAIRDAASGSLSARFESEGQPLAFPSATNLLFWKWDGADERLVIEHIDPRSGDRLGSRKYDSIQKSTTQKIVGSGDGRRLAVNRTEGHEVWETQTGRRMQVFVDPGGGSIRVVSFSGDYLVTEKRTGRAEGIFKIWHITDPKPRKVIPHKSLGDQGLLFSPREDVLAATDWAKNAVVLWNLRDGGIRSELIGHTSSVDQIAFSQDGRTLISRNRSDTRLWQVATAREIVRVGHGVKPLSPRLSMEDRVLGRSFSGNVEFWRLPEKRQARAKPSEAP